MKVILLQSVKSLGAAGTVHEVSDGYFRNFLQPQKMAAVASVSAIAAIARREDEQRKKAATRHARMQEMVQNLGKLNITMAREGGVTGTLYAGVTAKDIAKKLQECQLDIDEAHIKIQGPIKAVGDYVVKVVPGAGLEGSVKLKVVRKL